jgi:hypothetical protein
MDNKELQQQEIRAHIAHAQMLEHIKKVVADPSGRAFIKYLFKELGVAELPEVGLKDDMLHAYLGHLRAGNSIFKIVAQAVPSLAGELLAQIEKEKYENPEV